MRKFTLYLMVLALLASCKSQFPLIQNPQKAKDPNYKCFIKPKKGELVSGDAIEIKNQNKLFKATVFEINGQSFKEKEIQSYQSNDGYFVNLSGNGLTRALSGPRILAFRTFHTSTQYDASTGRVSTRQYSVYHFTKAGTSEWAIESLKATNIIAGWVEDNSDAYDYAQTAQRYVKKIKTHRLISWGAIIGGFALMMADPAVKSTAAPDAKLSIGYAGVLMVPAGFINLGLNLGRRGKVGRNLAQAINLYNDAPERKKKR